MADKEKKKISPLYWPTKIFSFCFGLALKAAIFLTIPVLLIIPKLDFIKDHRLKENRTLLGAAEYVLGKAVESSVSGSTKQAKLTEGVVSQVTVNSKKPATVPAGTIVKIKPSITNVFNGPKIFSVFKETGRVLASVPGMKNEKGEDLVLVFKDYNLVPVADDGTAVSVKTDKAVLLQDKKNAAFSEKGAKKPIIRDLKKGTVVTIVGKSQDWAGNETMVVKIEGGDPALATAVTQIPPAFLEAYDPAKHGPASAPEADLTVRQPTRKDPRPASSHSAPAVPGSSGGQ